MRNPVHSAKNAIRRYGSASAAEAQIGMEVNWRDGESYRQTIGPQRDEARQLTCVGVGARLGPENALFSDVVPISKNWDL
jgi:hypothetical protein